MRRGWVLLLYVIGIGCLAIAASYPIRYALEGKAVDDGMDRLRQMKALSEQAADDGTGGSAVNGLGSGVLTAGQETEGVETIQAAIEQIDADAGIPAGGGAGVAPDATQSADAAQSGGGAATGASGGPPADEPGPTIEPVDRRLRTKAAQPYPSKEKVYLDTAKILPKYREIYAENSDLVGWLRIEGTGVDYPVLQNPDSEYYLKRDFYGEENANGQLILDSKCDPYTPSYNLIISGHNMKSGKMFGRLMEYGSKSYWQKHKYVEFDTLMEEKTYVVVAAFYSADYDEDEEGFRYNADIQYTVDFEEWQREIMASRLYNTEIEMAFGDEFLTLTTCSYQRKDGRFVVIARKLRDGEERE